MIKVKTVGELAAGLYSEIEQISNDILNKMSTHVEGMITIDYTKRVQQSHYPLRNPMTKEVLESMPPVEIAKRVERLVSEDSAVVYMPPGTAADKSARMQELFGGKPWQAVRTKMQDLNYVNSVLPQIGLPGLRAKPTV